MYLIRRIAKTHPGKAWEVAGYLSKITQAYEDAGRNKATIYVVGQGLPGTPNVVYVEWTQERLDPIDVQKVPEAVFTNHDKMEPLLTEYSIEFYELVTAEKLKARGVD